MGQTNEKVAKSDKSNIVNRDEFEIESGDEDDTEQKIQKEDDNDDEADFLTMLQGPKECTPHPCSVCSIKMRKRRWRCWDCNVDLCGSCKRKNDSEHMEHLVSRDAVEMLQPARGTSIRKIFNEALDQFSERPCVGLIKKGSSYYCQNPPSSFPLCNHPYDWYSFKYLHERILNFSVGLKKKIPIDGFVAICGENCLEWIITDYACIFQGIVSVPIKPNFGTNDISMIMESTEPIAVVCAYEQISKYLNTAPSSLKYIIEMYRHQPIPLDVHQHNLKLAEKKGCMIFKFSEIEEQGALDRRNGTGSALNQVPNKSKSIITIGWTGGSTGAPKGCVLPERAWQKRLNSFFLQTIVDIQLVFEPFTHFNGRKQFNENLVQGGRTVLWEPSSQFTPVASHFFSPSAPDGSTAKLLASNFNPRTLSLLASLPDTHDCRKILTSVALLRPRRIFMLPMLWNLVYKKYMKVLDEAISLEDTPSRDRVTEITKEVQTLFRSIFSSRCTIFSSGSAAISPTVYAWMKKLFPSPCMVNDAYGAVECGGICNEGSPVHGIKIKLRDLPEMSYLTTDKPWPRGEILVKSPFLCLGYWKRPEETAAVFLENGWYATGDVGVEKNENGKKKYTIIDRAKSLWKVSTGEYLSPEKLEAIYIKSTFVSQICIIGDASIDYVIAIVVPNKDYISRTGGYRNTPTPTLTTTTTTVTTTTTTTITTTTITSISTTVIPTINEGTEKKKNEMSGFNSLNQCILDDLQRLAKEAMFQDFETPRHVHIASEPFTMENGLLTSVLKLNRNSVFKKYRSVIHKFAKDTKTRT